MSKKWKIPKNATPYIRKIAEGGDIPEEAEREIMRDWILDEDLQKHGEFTISALLDENGGKTDFGICSKCVARPINDAPRVFQLSSGRDRVKKSLILDHVKRWHVSKVISTILTIFSIMTFFNFGSKLKISYLLLEYKLN